MNTPHHLAPRILLRVNRPNLSGKWLFGAVLALCILAGPLGAQEYVFYASHTPTSAPAGTETEEGDFEFSNPNPEVKGQTWINPADYNGAQTPSKFKAVMISADPRKPEDPCLAATQTARLKLRKGLQLPDGEYRVSVVIAMVRPEADFEYSDANQQEGFTPANLKDQINDLTYHAIVLFEKRKMFKAAGNYYLDIHDTGGASYRNIFLDQVIFKKIP